MSDATIDKDVLVKKTFPVTGMHCASCAATVEKTLKTQKGVLVAGVNYANARAYVEYMPQKVSKNELKEAVEYTGYDLIIDDSPDVIKELETAKEKTHTILRTNTILAVIFSVPVVVISMFMRGLPYAGYICWALATPVVFFFGRQFFIGAWKQAKHSSANMDTLVAFSTAIAYLYSAFNVINPQFWTSKGIAPHIYFEASSVIITFILLGKLLEERAKTNASSAIKKLMGLQPNTVTRINKSGVEEVIPIAGVQLNDVLLIKPGEKIPVDGRVTEGSSYVDESMITGEPVAVLKENGESVLAGTINQKGSFHFIAEKLGSNTLLAHIIRAVEEAQGSKAPVQKLADKIAGIFVPVVITIAILSFLLWLWLGGNNGLTHGILALVTVLIIACPCALGLATPAAIIAGVGKGAENGILIKDAQSLELAHKINAVVLDKTGTLTEGHPEVEDIFWQTGADVFRLSSLLYSMESRSEHPLAEAVTTFLMNKGAGSMPISGFQSFSGAGVSAIYNGQLYYIGSKQFIASNNIPVSNEWLAKATGWLNEAKTVIWFTSSMDVLAVIAIADKIKDSAPAAVAQLQKMGIDVYMLTGDNARTAKGIAARAGIKNYKAETLPADKAAFIRQLQGQGKIVAMAGDGINDSEALALADVSIAMGKGTDIAMDVAKMTLISSDLLLIPKAINLSGKTVRLIRQNLFWAFVYNIIGIPLAAGILYPVNGFLLNPMIAGAAMALSSVSVVSNSLRLKRVVL